MVKKRERLEVIYDILKAIQNNYNSIGPTRLLQKSNLSPQMFKEYLKELTEKEFIKTIEIKNKKQFSISDKGFQFLAEYKKIIGLIESFGL